MSTNGMLSLFRPYLAFLLLGLLFGGGAWAADKRVALVIGNNDYRSVTRLEKAGNDARSVGNELRRLGFEVISVSNGSQKRMNQAIKAADAKAQYAEIVANERILTTSTLHTGAQLSTVSVTSVEFHDEGSDTLIVLTEHGIYLPGQEQPAWREHGTAVQLETLAAEFTTTAAPEEN
mgnify:CR=1 FL=1